MVAGNECCSMPHLVQPANAATHLLKRVRGCELGESRSESKKTSGIKANKLNLLSSGLGNISVSSMNT